MVCSIGNVKMTVMARTLASGGFQQGVTEKAGRQKLVGQYIQKELLEADDVNLIDEEDMHVFDLNPLTDHLKLVCCNSCKKPVKASQFLVHRERCSSLGFAVELPLDVDSGAGSRKPPKKDRKKMAYLGNHVPSTGAEERFAILDASEIAVSASQLDEPVGRTVGAKVDIPTPGKASGSVGEIIPSMKRPKLVAATTAQPSDDMHTLRDVPAPLATKMYYSQRNNRLQAAVSYMYHQTLTRECCAEERHSQGTLNTWDTSSQVFSDGQSDDCSKKKHFSSSPATQNTNQFVQSSAAGLIDTGCQSSNSSVDQLMTHADAYKSQVASYGSMTSKIQPKPFSFSGNSGQPLTRIQQPNGSVHVL